MSEQFIATLWGDRLLTAGDVYRLFQHHFEDLAMVNDPARPEVVAEYGDGRVELRRVVGQAEFHIAMNEIFEKHGYTAP